MKIKSVRAETRQIWMWMGNDTINSHTIWFLMEKLKMHHNLNAQIERKINWIAQARIEENHQNGIINRIIVVDVVVVVVVVNMYGRILFIYIECEEDDECAYVNVASECECDRVVHFIRFDLQKAFAFDNRTNKCVCNSTKSYRIFTLCGRNCFVTRAK